MILQSSFDWIDLISKVIGSFIATLFTILAWFILEYLKERKERKGIEKKVKELYEIFLSKRKELHTANHIINLLIYEIGIENVHKILKLSPKPIENGYLFEGSLYILSVSSSTLSNKIYIIKGRGIGVPTFDFDNPNEKEMVFNEFIEDFKKNCKESKISWINSDTRPPFQTQFDREIFNRLIDIDYADNNRKLVSSLYQIKSGRFADI